MSDNVTELHSGAKPAPDKKRWTILFASLLLIVFVLSLILFREQLNLDAISRFFRYAGASSSEEFGHFHYDSHGSNRYAAWDGGLAVASVSGLCTMDSNGKQTLSEEMNLRSPALRSSGDTLLFFDIGGSNAGVLRKGGAEILDLKTDGKIFDADVSSGGTVCIAASESGYKTVLRVYDGDNKEIYRWFSASRFLPLCAVSPDGNRVAAVSYGQKDGSFCCFLNVFRTNREEPENEIELGGGLIYDLRFLQNDRICLIGENEIRVIRTNGKTVGSFDLQAWYLSGYDLGGDGFILAELNMYKAGNRCTLSTVNTDGEEIANCFIDSEILDIAAAGRYVAVLTTQELVIYRRNLTVYSRTPNVWMASKVLLRPDGTAIAVSGNSAELYLP